MTGISGFCILEGFGVLAFLVEPVRQVLQSEPPSFDRQPLTVINRITNQTFFVNPNSFPSDQRSQSFSIGSALVLPEEFLFQNKRKNKCIWEHYLCIETIIANCSALIRCLHKITYLFRYSRSNVNSLFHIPTTFLFTPTPSHLNHTPLHLQFSLHNFNIFFIVDN